MPRPSYDAPEVAALPVVARRDEIKEAVAAHQVVIVCGETGSGKTTQLPKICLELGRGVSGLIGHTQPRRIAARAVAQRLADELGSPLGTHAGYKIRFADRSGARGRAAGRPRGLGPDGPFIKVMTDGILLAETRGDRDLRAYDTLIIDEAHERSLNIDFLLGYLRRLLPGRPDLKLIITSATIDPQRFSDHFGGAPVIEVSGRAYPVETLYRPIQPDQAEEADAELRAILRAIDEADRLRPRGDVLVFLPGEREIREAAEAIRKHHPPGATEILPLYSRLSMDEQNRVFRPRSARAARRIVLATNVAETSLTVPGIRVVIDPGLARINRYSPRARVQRLPIEPVSRASADQRRGRAGRVAPGTCLRLYSEDDYESRPRFTDPEIQRTNLASVILQMIALGLGEVDRFPFIDPPDQRRVRDGYDTLLELGAIDEQRRLTPVGRELARLPIDPRLARMILAARRQGALAEVLVIAAALSVQDPRERPMEPASLAEEADRAHERFRDPASDFLSYLNLWAWFHEQAGHLSQNKLRKLCKDSFVHYLRMREWHEVHSQLHAIACEREGKAIALAGGPPDYDAIHRALLTGLVSSVGCLTSNAEYAGPGGLKFHLHPGSTLFRAKPKWVMAAELVKTARLYARTCARIEPGWIEQLAPHLVKRSYSEPEWVSHSGGGQVFAHETVTLNGLTVVPHRRVKLGPIDPALSRQIFISRALVEGDFLTDAPFVAHNRRVLEDGARLEAKARKRDLVVGPDLIHAFYDRIVPSHVYNGPGFEKWRRHAEKTRPGLLRMALADVLVPGALEHDAAARAEQFPDVLHAAGAAIPLEYRLEPGEPADGVTAVIPAAIAARLPPEPFEWLVPGMVKEKVIALLRALPKEARRALGPAPEAADRILERLRARAGATARSLVAGVAEEAGRLAGIPLDAADTRPAELPDHLRMNFRIVDDAGNALAEGRDLLALRRALAAKRPGGPFLHADPGEAAFAERDGLTDWTFGDLPERVTLKRAGYPIDAFPALVDRGASVSLRLMASADAAAAATRAGLRRLFLLQLRGEILSLIDTLPEIERRRAEFAALASTIDGPRATRTLDDELAPLVADRAFLADPPFGEPVRTAASFQSRLDSGWNRLGESAMHAGAVLSRVIAANQALELRLGAIRAEPGSPPAEALDDARVQRARLLAPGFAAATPFRWLQQLPRFLRAIEVRFEKLALRGLAGVEQDRRLMASVHEFQRAYEARSCAAGARGTEADPAPSADPPRLAEFRWMVEEYRVSLFAQQLRTSVPVSEKRLREALAALDHEETG